MKLNRRVAIATTATAGLLCTAAALAPSAGATGGAIAHTTRTTAAAAGAHGTSAKAATYNGACGSGYKVVNSAQIGSRGTVYLTYNSSTGKNCVVTVRTTTGKAQHMVASIGTGMDTDTQRDEGKYTSYAGPIYLKAAGQCVNWRGEIAGEIAGKDQTNCSKLAASASQR
ncbi:spore-associated protein A [Streptomyces sp. NPDC058045]|uniref:spore-associated protein A n=1 Tax=Streptomyces sp. NPDC058045 TaxID=3346311 RepID=UPI0036F06B5B